MAPAPLQRTLSWQSPATTWTQALPVGNGTFGVLDHGGHEELVCWLNHATLWSGSPACNTVEPMVDPETAADCLAKAREAITSGHASEATPWLQRLQHRHSQAFLPLAQLRLALNVPSATETLRSLDLRDGITRSTTRHGHVRVDHDLVVCQGRDVMLLRLWTDAPDGVDVTVSVTSPLRMLHDVRAPGSRELGLQAPSDVYPAHDRTTDAIAWDETPGAAMRAAVAAGWTHDGHEDADGVIRALHRLLLVVGAATTFRGLGDIPGDDVTVPLDTARALAAEALGRGWESLLAEHRALRRPLMDRCWLAPLPAPEGGVEQRLRRIQADGGAHGAQDPDLIGCLFDMGRHLLACSAAPGGVPPNLQGIWNGALQPPWSSNHTINVNTEMNHWSCGVAQLPETLEPLVDLVCALSRTGADTASRLYGAPGWVAHHNTDAWGYPEPVGHGTHDPSWAFWPWGGVWLLLTIVHQLPLCPPAQARRIQARLWPVLVGAAEFALTFSQVDEDGRRFTCPSTSPENVFVDAVGKPAAAGISSTMDLGLLAELFDAVVDTAHALNADDAVVDRCLLARRQIATPEPTPMGLIPEWRDDPTALDPHHRHQSHLYALHPGPGQVSETFARAAAASLDARGTKTTGWSLVWRIALRARLRQPTAVGELLDQLLRLVEDDGMRLVGGVYPNLFAAHPPFQVDANLGFPAALAECLVQGHLGEVELLPALPPQLPTGGVQGVATAVGVVVDLTWRDGLPMSCRAWSMTGQVVSCRFRHGERTWQVDVGATPVDVWRAS